MTVSIVSGIPIFAGPLNIVTSIQAPNIPGGGALGIGDIVGLEAALLLKLDDDIGVLGPVPTAVTVTGAELNFLAGVTSLVQTQLDGKVDVAGDLMIGDLFFGGGVQLHADFGTAMLPGIVFGGDLDTGFWWPGADTLGIAVGALDAFHVLPSGLLQSQVPGYETLVAAGIANDIPNKKYVDDEIALAVGGPFLPLAGGIMTGDIDLNGVARLRLDADGNSFFEALADDLVNLWIGGSVEFFWNATCFDMGGKKIADVLDPTAAQEAATMNYVDTEILALNLGGTTGPYLPLSGVDAMTGALNLGTNLIQSVSDPSEGQDAATKNYVDTEIIALSLNGTGPYLRLSGVDTMTGNLDMAGNSVILDVDLDTFIESAADDLMRVWVGGANVLDLDGITIDAKVQRITDVLDPTAAQDAATMNYVDTEILALGLGGATGPFLRLSGADTMVGDLDMGTNQINAVVDPTLAQDAATKNYADTTFMPIGGGVPATGDLDMGGFKVIDLGTPTGGTDATTKDYVDTFLPLAGGTMSGILSMGSNLIQSVSDPSEGQDAATKNYVDTEISALSSGVFVSASGDTMTGDLLTDSGVQFSADAGTIGAPSYAFTGDLDSGFWWDGTNLRWAIGGASALSVSPGGGANEVDVHGRQVVGVADPTAADHAVSKGFLDSQAMVKLLGSVSGVDLLSTGTTTIYTVPTGKMHIITQILVRTTAYTPGGAPSNPEISVGLTIAIDQIVDNNTVLDWGGVAGAADQVVYVQPKDGADTPNALDLVRFQVDTAGGGTFAALAATVYVLGIEL